MVSTCLCLNKLLSSIFVCWCANLVGSHLPCVPSSLTDPKKVVDFSIFSASYLGWSSLHVGLETLILFFLFHNMTFAGSEFKFSCEKECPQHRLLKREKNMK